MKPSYKLQSLALTLATTIVFTIWIKIIPMLQLNDFTKIIIGTLTSISSYRFIATTIIYLMSKSSKIKKYFLGSTYLEGTWVGFYIGSQGKVRFIIESFEQDVDNLIIRGKSYDDSSKYHAAWVASNVNIDASKGIISYMYDCIPINDNSNGNGIAIFNFSRKNQYSKAEGIMGFSADLHIGKRVRAFEIKISDKCFVNETKALIEAKKLYDENKNIF